jgi:hypothetical protein
MIPQVSHEAGCANSRSNLTVNVPKLTSFHVPQGPHSATIKSASKKRRESGRSSIPIVRLVFAVHIPDPKFNYLAKVDFEEDLNEGGALWNVLCRLLGRKALEDCSGSQFNLRTLKDLECDVEIEHIYDDSDDYEFPLPRLL